MVLNNPPLWLLPQVLHLAGRAPLRTRHYVQAHAYFERRSALPAAAKTEQHHENGNEPGTLSRTLVRKRETAFHPQTPSSRPDTYLDVADFTGQFMWRKFPARAGLVASTDILPGTQIMVNKAFGVFPKRQPTATITRDRACHNEQSDNPHRHGLRSHRQRLWKRWTPTIFRSAKKDPIVMLIDYAASNAANAFATDGKNSRSGFRLPVVDSSVARRLLQNQPPCVPNAHVEGSNSTVPRVDASTH
ncbi:hypothetical protein BV898_01142 [Hypsibius exemplaris]|uniref:Uncharacterized protein n=1 Tax=Hypsibius exemplaris TaxID=2072580 RepID=A0A1W0XBX3_HYPEX|nr:hypothetical protein BV898_01142 [Hypsibius exemplaris]